MMDEIAGLMARLANAEGLNETFVPGVGIYKASESQPRQPICYQQGILIVGQGSKRVFLGDRVYHYNPENYLVLTVPIPAECESYATPEEPVLLLTVDIDLSVLGRIIGRMDEHMDHALLSRNEKHPGLFLARANQGIKDTVLRLLRALQSPVESSVLGEGIVHELIFRIMCGENAASLYALAVKNTNLSRVDKALKKIHRDYSAPMDVDGLATLVNMSPSAFHRAFKDVTASSPIQYIKKLRLDKARGLLAEGGFRVNEAATEVGYESATQFSREFKRHFGTTPATFINHQAAV